MLAIAGELAIIVGERCDIRGRSSSRSLLLRPRGAARGGGGIGDGSVEEKLATEVLRLELHFSLDELIKMAEGKRMACARTADSLGLSPSTYRGVERCDPGSPGSGVFSRR